MLAVAQTRVRPRLLTVLAAASVLSGHAAGQCSPAWQPASAVPGFDSTVYATTAWDPDGAGPATPVRVFCGDFAIAGDTFANRIATWDPATGAFAPLGTGMNGSVLALAVAANGELVAGGDFSIAGGQPALGIARWNGATWVPFPSPLNSRVRALAVLPGGDLVAGGDFTTAGGVTVNYIARWNGTSWSALGTGMQWPVRALAVMPNGDLVAGGDFSIAGGVSAPRVARWNGSTWSALGTGIPGATEVRAMTVLPNGDLVVGGLFANAGGVPASNVARWNGSSWSALGAGVSFSVSALHALPNGDVFAGAFQSNGTDYVARWNGSAWASVGGFPGWVFDFDVLPNGEVLACGSFWPLPYSLPPGVVGIGAFNVARWDGTAWSPITPGIDRTVLAVSQRQNGDVVVGGKFTMIGGIDANRVASWNGSSYTPLGTGLDGTVSAFAELPNGDLIAAGEFLHAGGVPAAHIARWDGTAWHALGSGIDYLVAALHVMPNGDLLAGGTFSTAGGVAAPNLARWDGTTWSAFGSPTGGVYAFATMANGDLAVGGDFPSIGGVTSWGIATWDGATWTPLNFIVSFFLAPTIRALNVRPDGALIAGGTFAFMGNIATRNIARWDGVVWGPLGSGPTQGTNHDVFALATLPSGDLLAAGKFTTVGGQSANRIARWNGATWSPFGVGTDEAIYDLTVLASGEVCAVGNFVTAGGAVSPYLARVASTCPATAAPFGNSCPSSGGSNTLSVVTLPWVESTFRAIGTGLPPTSLVITVTGLHGTVPGIGMDLVFRIGTPGCDLVVSPDILGLVLTNTGTAMSEFFLPNSPSIVGVTFYHQMIPIELDAQGNWVSVTATNALQLTAGAF